jgi:hypothetical protein
MLALRNNGVHQFEWIAVFRDGFGRRDGIHSVQNWIPTAFIYEHVNPQSLDTGHDQSGDVVRAILDTYLRFSLHLLIGEIKY